MQISKQELAELVQALTEAQHFCNYHTQSEEDNYNAFRSKIIKKFRKKYFKNHPYPLLDENNKLVKELR